MFNLLANAFQTAGGQRSDVFRVHPAQLSRWLDELWGVGPAALFGGAPVFLGAPGAIVASLDKPPAGAPALADVSGINVAAPGTFSGALGPVPAQPVWEHLMYAYLLENTGMAEIFREVVRLGLVGERLSAQLSNQSLQWLRATEELFFRPAPSFSIGAITSELRPESRLVRRNAYWRMFGIDLAHPLPASESQSWKLDVGGGANTSFREKWTEVLRQVWLAQENSQNTSGTNPTDDAYLVLLCDALRDMMNMRRRGGSLAREEFASVALSSWFELTVSADTPIVTDLNASASSPADRLALIGQRVGIAPAPRSRELFQLGQPVSLILRLIEAGFFAAIPAVQLLYVPASLFLRPLLTTIIDNWQSATGESIKGRSVVARPDTLAPAQPLRAPGSQPLAPAPSGQPALNGTRR